MTSSAGTATVQPYASERKLHLYHCDRRGLPLALIDTHGRIAWQAEFDEWGNMLQEENPGNLQQLIRLPGQQYDAETGLYYNRHRYYDPQQGRYITQDPIGLMGGVNFYSYPLDPVTVVDPLGLFAFLIPIAEWGVAEVMTALGSAAVGGSVLAIPSSSETKSAPEESLDTNSELDKVKDGEYQKAKSFCDKKPEKGSNNCASLSKAIDHAKLCANLYEDWDSKWFPGRHDVKIQERRGRIKNLSDQHRKECTNK